MAGVSVAAFGSKNANERNARAKARYFFTKGSVSEATGNFDQAYEYFKKAYDTDSTFTDAAYFYGQFRLLLPDTFSTDAERARSLNLIKKHYEAYPNDVKTAESYASFAKMLENYPEAIRVYKKILEGHESNQDLTFSLASCYLEADQLDSAIDVIRRYEKIVGEDFETLMSKVSYFGYKKDTIGALNEIKGYSARHPDDVQGYLNLAKAYSMFGFMDSVQPVYENALKLHPENGEIKYRLASSYAEKGDSATFHQLVREVFDDMNDDEEQQLQILWTYLYEIQDSESDFREADQLFSHVYSIYPENAEFLDIYSNYELKKDNTKEAYRLKKKALELDPENTDYLASVVAMSVALDKPEEGIRIYESFPESDEARSFDCLLPYISAVQKTGKYSKALELVENYIQNEGEGLSLRDTITDERFEELIEKLGFYSLFSLSSAFEIAGDLYAKIGSPDDVVRSYENSLKLLFGVNASAQNNYAYYLIETMKVEPGSEEFEKARELSRESLEMTEDNPQGTYYDTYAWILFKDHEYKEALEYQEIAIDLTEEDEYSSELFSHYGDILFMLGQPLEALEQWKKALELEPDNKLLKKKVANKTFFYE